MTITSFPNSPRLLKAGVVLLTPGTPTVQQIIALQYNPDSLSRTLQVQAVGDGGNRSQPFRLMGPAVETFKIDAEIDATDQLEFPEQNQDAAKHGIFPQLAALESLIYPTSAALQANNALAAAGTLEIVPMETPLSLFIWSQSRIVPVRVTDFSVTEEAFDPSLNPIRAKVSLGMRVLSIDDLGFDHKGGSLFMSYLQAKEQLARKAPRATLATLGITQEDLQ